jgi:hypothetical protein
MTHWFGGFSAPGGVETKAALLRHEGGAADLSLSKPGHWTYRPACRAARKGLASM